MRKSIVCGVVGGSGVEVFKIIIHKFERLSTSRKKIFIPMFFLMYTHLIECIRRNPGHF